MSGCSGWQSVNPLCRAGQLLGSAAKEAGNDVFGGIADYFAGVAQSATTWLWDQLNSATAIDLTAPGIESDLVATGAIAAIVTFGLFLIQVISSALRQDGNGLGRAVRGLGVSFIGAAFAIGATQALLAAVDGLCNAVVRYALDTDIRGAGSKLIVALTLSNVGNPAGLLLLSLVLIAAVVVVWVALMIRKLLIIVSAVFAPLAFSGASSDISRSWVRRWIEFTVALVFSKLILVIIFLIGLSVLNEATTSGSGSQHSGSAALTNLVIGALTLLLAGFAPWIAIKMVHFAGDSFHHMHVQGGSALAGAQTAAAVPQKVATVVKPQAAAALRASGAGRNPGAGTGGQPKAGPPGAAGLATAGAVAQRSSQESTTGAALSRVNRPAQQGTAAPAKQPVRGGVDEPGN